MTLKTLLSNTMFVIFWKYFKYWKKLISQKKIVNPVLHNKAFKSILAQELGVNKIKQDRAGRLYCILNPQINTRGQFDTNMIIYELDSQGIQFSTETFIEQWLVRKLRIIQDLFKQREIFSLLNFNIEHVGPVNHDNYLLIIEPSGFSDYQFWKSTAIKKLIKLLTFIAVIYGIMKIYQFCK